MRWTVVIPAKALPAAKSRLAPASSGPEAHRRLVEAIRADTVQAALAADGVARVLLVVDRTDGLDAPADAQVLVQQRPGLNAALDEAADHAAVAWPDEGVAALVGDLPALRAPELAGALLAAGEHDRAYVPDAAGTGTTLLTARPGAPLAPAFGPGSAGRHATGASPVQAGPGLRHDVDTAADLQAAGRLGLGPETTRVLADTALEDHGDTRRSTSDGIMNG